MPAVNWGTLVDALSSVERLGASESGLLSFGNTPVGGIFIEGGRVCWVAARGLQRRLRDLLRTHSSMDGAELDRMYERCRAEGLLLGQTLVAEGLLQPRELESALRRHSAECLVELCRGGESTSWASRAGRGYAPRFTFRAVDLLFDSVALFYPELQSEARRELASFDGPGRRGVAFVFDADIESLLPLAETGEHDLEAMLGLGRAVAAIPRASLELGTTPAFSLSTTAAGTTILLWWRDAVLFALSCADRASLAAATAQHLACA